MSEPVTKQRPPIDFDAFERAVRDSAQPSRHGQEEDPLAELARLVGTHHDPYGEVFAQDEAHQPAHQRRPSIDFAAIEAGLRGTIPAHEAHQDHAPYDDHGSYAHHDEAARPQAESGWHAQASAGTPVRSRRPVYAMAAVIVAGVVGIGVAFAYKGPSSGPREIAMIKAAPGPTKIQPPADAASDQPTRDASILDKAQQPAPTKLVSREEQPVDLAQAVQSAPRDVGLTPLYNFGGANGAASVPVPAPPGQQADQKPAVTGIAGDIEPIRVKTRSYRPDGTPIPNDQPPAAAIPAATPPSKVDKAVVAKASTSKSVAPKSTTRVAATPKPIVTADNGDAAPADLNAAAALPSPQKGRPVKSAATKPMQTASVANAANDPAPTASVGGSGGFAVQLAAPGSEAEAKQMSARLSAKFASALSGHRLSFHKAESNGKSVYRVRVVSLSREEATGMCEKLKSSGGSCFVAKN
jgi:hypothetical protein